MNVNQNVIEPIKSGTIAKVNEAANAVASQANQIVSGLTSKLQSAALAGSDIISAVPTIGQYIFGSVGSLFKEVNVASNTLLGNFSQETKSIIEKNFNQIPKTLSAFGSGSLSSQGLGFIASTTSKAIQGVDLPGVDPINNFSSMGIGQLARLSTLGSEVLNSSKNAIQAVTGALQEGITTGKNIIKNVTSTVANPVMEMLSPVISVAEPISSLLNPFSVSNTIYSNLDFLPNSVRSYVAEVAGTAITNTSANALNSLGSIFGVNNLAGAAKTASDILTRYNNTYLSQADPSGNYVNGISSYNGDVNNFNQLINLASDLCSSLKGKLPTIDFSTNKNLYDMLIQLACEMGLGGIADMLLNCFESADLFDDRTKKILGDVVRNSAYRGDTFSTSISFKYGSSYITNKNGILTTLIANSEYNSNNKKNIEETFSNSGTTISELMIKDFFYKSPVNSIMKSKSKEKEPVVYDAEIITVMQNTCTDYVDEIITKNDRNLVNEIYAVWH